MFLQTTGASIGHTWVVILPIISSHHHGVMGEEVSFWPLQYFFVVCMMVFSLYWRTVYVWSESNIIDFIGYLNNNCFGLSFIVTHHFSSITFLDLTLSVDADSTIRNSTYHKPKSGNTILYATSHHPKHIIKNIPVGEMLWAKGNCSSG